MGTISLLTQNPFFFAINLIAIIISITIHEAAHAFVADRLGDPTSKLAGRITLNPAAHLDPLGIILLILTGFGWGKPVLYDPYNLRNPRRDAGLIAIAGPTVNLFLAILLSLLIRFTPLGSSSLSIAIFPIIITNVALAIFNLIPAHPLDGSKILVALAPHDVAHEWDHTLTQYGTFILILLIVPFVNGTSAVSYLITPIINFIMKLLLGL